VTRQQRLFSFAQPLSASRPHDASTYAAPFTMRDYLDTATPQIRNKPAPRLPSRGPAPGFFSTDRLTRGRFRADVTPGCMQLTCGFIRRELFNDADLPSPHGAGGYRDMQRSYLPTAFVHDGMTLLPDMSSSACSCSPPDRTRAYDYIYVRCHRAIRPLPACRCLFSLLYIRLPLLPVDVRQNNPSPGVFTWLDETIAALRLIAAVKIFSMCHLLW